MAAHSPALSVFVMSLCLGAFETRLALIAVFDGTAITLLFSFGAPWLAKISSVPFSLFFCVCVCGSCIWPESWGLVCVSTRPDMMLLVDTWGLGAFSMAEAALSEMRFLCSKFHYIRVHQGGGGVRRQLVYGTGTQWMPAPCKHVPSQIQGRIYRPGGFPGLQTLIKRNT